MRIAVTGATGFIGRHVITELVGREGLDVVAVCRVSNAKLAAPGVKVVRIAIEDPIAGQFERMGSPDILIHLAWDGLPNYQSPHHFDHHLTEQYRFLTGLISAGLPSLVCAGSCLEYGMRCGELGEDLIPDPQNPYALAKDALRRSLTFLRGRTECTIAWMRLFYTFGADQTTTALYGQLAAAIARGDRSFPMSPGQQLRDYLPISEMARLIAELAVRRPDCGVVNVCSGVPISVRSLVERWLAEKGCSMKLQLGEYDYPSYEPMAFWGSRKKLDSILARR